MISTNIFSYIGVIAKRDIPSIKLKFVVDSIFNVYRLYINYQRTDIVIPLKLEEIEPKSITEEEFLKAFFEKLTDELKARNLI